MKLLTAEKHIINVFYLKKYVICFEVVDISSIFATSFLGSRLLIIF